LSAKNFKVSEGQRTTLGKVADSHVAVSFYGKVVDDLTIPTGVALQHPQDGGTLHAGHIFGYSQGHQCFRFTPPRIYMLPDPAGPADGCGWDPAQFVVWKLPPDWLTLYFEVQHATIRDSLTPRIGGDSRLSAGQCLTIASDCVFDETGNPQPIDRTRSLLSYGINSPEQASGVRTRVVNSSTLGVPRFNFQIDANSLKDLAGSWTLGQLADRIQDSAVPA